MVYFLGYNKVGAASRPHLAICVRRVNMVCILRQGAVCRCVIARMSMHLRFLFGSGGVFALAR